MTVDYFFQIVAAVVVGGLIFSAILWNILKIERLERSGVHQRDLPIIPMIIIVAAGVFVCFMISTLEHPKDLIPQGSETAQ